MLLNVLFNMYGRLACRIEADSRVVYGRPDKGAELHCWLCEALHCITGAAASLCSWLAASATYHCVCVLVPIMVAAMQLHCQINPVCGSMQQHLSASAASNLHGVSCGV
jgi:hypothetical protein